MPSDRVLQNCGVRRPLGGGILPAAMHSCVDRSRVVICDLALSNGHKWALVHIPRNVLVMYQGSKLFTYLGQWPYKVWDCTSKNCFNLDRGPCWVCGVTLSILWDSTHSASHNIHAIHTAMSSYWWTYSLHSTKSNFLNCLLYFCIRVCPAVCNHRTYTL